jgi:hypothetical protein
MLRTRLLVLAALLPATLLACSGNVVVEPAEQTSKRAKNFLAKCPVPAPPDGAPADLKTVYACLPAEDTCPSKDDKATAAELGYILDKGKACSSQITVVYDVPCGPDLNAVECCYAVRVGTSAQACD